MVICHGGPISSPADATYILQNTKNVHGFYGASSMERLPTEIALTQQTKAFKNISF
jgi:predicted TIM-barrel enzyme